MVDATSNALIWKYGNYGNIWNSYYECYNALQCNHLHIKIYDERPPLIIVQLTCSGLREDEDRRDVGRRWLQQEQLWICVREAPDMLVFAIFHLQIWPTFKIRMQPGMSLLKKKIISDSFLWISFPWIHLLMFPQNLQSDFPVVGVLKDWNWVRICRWSITGDQMCQHPDGESQIFHRFFESLFYQSFNMYTS